jgi:hypothetical protein
MQPPRHTARNSIGLALAVAASFLSIMSTGSRAQMPTGDPAEEFGVRIARVKYGGGGDWYADPSSIPNRLAETF